MKIQYLIRSCLLALFLAAPAFADPPAIGAFSTLSIGGGVVPGEWRNSLQPLWESGRGWEGFIRTPFYLGEIQLGLQRVPFRGQSDNLPDYRNWYYYLQWGAGRQLLPGVRGFAGVIVGNSLMRFDAHPLYPGEESVSESELTAGIGARLSFHPGKNWALEIAADYRTIFTRTRIRQGFVGMMINHTFQTPAWLRNMLE